MRKELVRIAGGGGTSQEGDQKDASKAWSEPSESSKETWVREKSPVAMAMSLARKRSRTDGCWASCPIQVATWGGERRERPEQSNQSSKVAAQEEVVT
jgi:hypothetical protein